MIKIKYLCQFPNYIPDLAKIWHETIGKKWLPDIAPTTVEEKLKIHLNQESLPISFIALNDAEAIGMVALRDNDGVRPDLLPWLGSLCVSEAYRQRGVGKLLIDMVKIKAKKMGFKKLYLFTFDEQLVNWYEDIGWTVLEKNSFKDKPITVMWTGL